MSPGWVVAIILGILLGWLIAATALGNLIGRCIQGNKKGPRK